MRYSVLLTSLLMLGGCATSQPPQATSKYRLEGSQAEFDEFSVQRAYRAVNARRFTDPALQLDQSTQFLEAPQPTMPSGDVAAGVSGEVQIFIFFGEDGLVERTKIIRSTRESLFQAVIEAVSRWRITPPMSNGKPTKLVALQTFTFQTE